MKSIAKWVAILWSIFCLIFVVIGIITSEESVDPLHSLASCFFIWIVIAGPAFIIYLVSGKKESPQSGISQSSKQSRLCIECGKYFSDEPRFCPHCGKSTKFNK